MIQDVPKCTLPVQGKPLVRISVETLLAHGCEVIVCVGYRHELVEKALAGLPVHYYYNPFYAMTNSIGTLWFAEKELTGDLLIMNADVYFDSIILENLINSSEKAVMASDVTRVKTGDYFFATRQNDDCLVKYGKDLPLESRTSEYVGMSKISGSFAPLFRERIKELVGAGHYDLWWENVLYSFVEEGKDVHTIDVNGAFWAEVDFFDDYERITNHAIGQKKV